MNRIALIAAVLIAVTVTGCTDSGDQPSNRTTVSATDGLDITFRSIASTYLEDEELRAQMDLSNTGQAEATEISVDLSGSSVLGQHDIVQQPVSRLRPTDPGTGETGGSTQAVWAAANSLDLEQGETQSVSLSGTATYRYETRAQTAFDVVPRSAFDGATEPVTVDNTGAPVHAGLDMTTPRPIFVDRSENVMSVPVTIRNVGDGTVPAVGFDVSLSNVGDQVTIDSCAGTEPDEFPVNVPLFEGGSREIICRLNMTELSDTLRFESTVPLDITLNYTYTEERSTRFTIEGLPGDQSDG